MNKSITKISLLFLISLVVSFNCFAEFTIYIPGKVTSVNQREKNGYLDIKQKNVEYRLVMDYQMIEKYKNKEIGVSIPVNKDQVFVKLGRGNYLNYFTGKKL
jgi:uncharacterized membrane protein